MGAEVSTPNEPADNEAKANNDIALKGLEDTAQRFLSDCRLAVPNSETLGYALTDNKLQAQELKLLSQTTSGVLSSEIEDTIDAIFSSDWKGVVKSVSQQLAQFFSSEVPAPSEAAVYQKFQKSYLKYEFFNVVEYSILVIQTNATSTGTLTENTQACLQACVCKGLVDYAKLDPQTFLFQLTSSNPDLTIDQIQEIIEAIAVSLKNAAELAKLKQELENPTAGTLARASLTQDDDVKLETSNLPGQPFQTYKQRVWALNSLKEEFAKKKMKKKTQAARVQTAIDPMPVHLDIRVDGAPACVLSMALRKC